MQKSAFPSTLLWMIPGIVGGFLLHSALSPVHGQIGADFYHQFSRLISNAVFVWQNGWQIQHYTPSLCGGLPAFADPQNMQMSLLQWLTYVWEPWTSYRIHVGVFYFLGYLGMWRLARQGLRTAPAWAHLAALLFSLNGFWFAHLWAGHLTHLPYALIPWMLVFVWPTQFACRKFLRWIGFTLLWTYLVWSGSVHMGVVFAVTLLLCLPYLLLTHHRQRTLRPFLIFLIAGIAASVVLSLAKILPVLRYAPYFYDRPLDLSSQPPWVLFFRFFWFLPAQTPPYELFGRYAFNAWEFVGFLSKAALPLLVFPLYRCFTRPTWVTALSLGIGLWIVLLAVGLGGNEALPFFATYHNPIKLFAGLIPVFVVVSAATLQQLRPEGISFGLFLLFAVGLLVETASYQHFFIGHQLGIQYPYDPQIYFLLKKKGALPPVAQVTKEGGRDMVGLLYGQTDLGCYEPTLGYRRENLKTPIHPGPTLGEKGHFNLTDPSCLLYPNYFGCSPWSRVREKTQFVRFVTGRPAFGVPKFQRVLQWFDGLAIFFLLLIAAFLFWRTRSLRD